MHRTAQTETEFGPAWPIYCTQWMDAKLITMLTTFAFPVSTILRRLVVTNKSTKLKTFTRTAFTVPACIIAYNFGKGTVYDAHTNT